MCFVCRQPGGGKLQGSGRVDESSVLMRETAEDEGDTEIGG